MRVKKVRQPPASLPPPSPPAPVLNRFSPSADEGPGVGLRERLRALPRTESCDYPWYYLVDMVSGSTDRPYERIDMNPDYQRKHVWRDDQASAFVGHLLDGGDAPKLYLQRYDSQAHVPPGGDYLALPMEVIDGKQRITAMVRWMRGEIPAIFFDGAEIWYRQTSLPERRALMVRLHFVDLPRAARLRFYLRLNRGGTVHTYDELYRVERLLADEEAKG